MNIAKLSSHQELQARLESEKTEDVRVYRRATALLALHEGLSPRQVARLLGVSRQTVYNWIGLYTGNGGALNLADSPRCGRPSLWTADLQAFLRITISQSPKIFGYSARDWTARMLQIHIASVRQVRVSKEALRLYLRATGYEWRNGRYVVIEGRDSALGEAS